MMQDIRNLVQLTLDRAFARQIPVVAEELVTDKMPEEYIAYSVVSGTYSAYANNRPIQRRDSVDVDWHGSHLSKKDARMAAVEAAMRSAGFLVESLPYDLGRDPVSRRYGATMEFVLYRTV